MLTFWLNFKGLYLCFALLSWLRFNRSGFCLTESFLLIWPETFLLGSGAVYLVDDIERPGVHSLLFVTAVWAFDDYTGVIAGLRPLLLSLGRGVQVYRVVAQSTACI